MPHLEPFLTLADVPYGGYLAWYKALPFVLVFLAWVKLLIWIDKDAAANRMPREAINSGLWAVLLGGILAAVLIPTFVVPLVVFTLLAILSVGGYLLYRKQVVGLDDIPEAFSRWLKNLFKSKKARLKEREEIKTAEGALTLLGKGNLEDKAPAEDDPARPAYDAAHRLLTDPLYKGADRVLFANAGGRYASKYRVDGVDYPGTAVEADAAQGAIDHLKELAGIDTAERRKQQKGKFKAKTALATHDLDIQTSGTRSGETLLVEVDRSKRYRDRASALGMTPAQRELVADGAAQNSGLVLAAAPTGGGLTALLYGLVQEHDAFVQHILTLEKQPERELEGTTQTTLAGGSDAAEEAKQAAWIVDQEPDVLLGAGLETKEAARTFIRLAGEDRKRVYWGLRADDCAAALKKWRGLVGDDKVALSKLRMVIAGRSMRKLCEVCKEPYTPNDAAFAKMGLPKGKVKTLYRARTEPLMNDRGVPIPCEHCGQLGYKGRVGAFEVLMIDDEARRSLLKDSGSGNVRNLIRGQKLPTLTEAAVRAVVAGSTDLQEVQRVMNPPSSGDKAKAAAPRPSSSSPKAPAPPVAAKPA